MPGFFRSSSSPVEAIFTLADGLFRGSKSAPRAHAGKASSEPFRIILISLARPSEPEVYDAAFFDL